MKFNKIVTSILFSLAFAVSSSVMASGTHAGAGHESEKEKSEKTDCGNHAHEAGKKDVHAEDGADKCNKSAKADEHPAHSH